MRGKLASPATPAPEPNAEAPEVLKMGDYDRLSGQEDEEERE